MTQAKSSFSVAKTAAGVIERKAGELRRAAELIEEMLDRNSFVSAMAAADLAKVLIDEISKADVLLHAAAIELKAKHGGDV